MNLLIANNNFLRTLKKIGAFSFFISTCFGSHLNTDSEVVVRLVVREKGTFFEPYNDKRINHADIGVVFEKRLKQPNLNEYIYSSKRLPSTYEAFGRKEIFWALSATFGPANDDYISTFFLPQKNF